MPIFQSLIPLALIMGASSAGNANSANLVDPDAQKPMAIAPTPDIQVETVMIALDMKKRMTVNVAINGEGDYDFLIDTGSERTAISRHLAEKLQLEAAAPTKIISVAGERMANMAYIPSLTMGKSEYGELVAPLLESLDIGADGILGLDGLQGKRVLFDFREKQITIESRYEKFAHNGYEITVTARPRSGQLIFTDATIDGVDVTVVIDTGAETSIGNGALYKRLADRRKYSGDNASRGKMHDVAGHKADVDILAIDDFQLGAALYPKLAVAFLPSPAFKRLKIHNKPAILLGMDALRLMDRMAIDFDKRRVYFDVPKG